MNIKEKRVTVVGLGNSGINAALLALEAGADVFATDSRDSDQLKDAVKIIVARGAKVELGLHTKAFVSKSDLVIVSPGVEKSALPVIWAEEEGIPIISEMEFGFRFCMGKIIAITGTNGKSTVTKLIGDILRCGGLDTIVCGNIGNSLCGEISRIGESTWVVLEVSSFQLERIATFKPHIAIILNITDDHLDRYQSFDGYFAEKMKIFLFQGADDYLILNGDAENLAHIPSRAPSKVLTYSRKMPATGAFLRGERLICRSRSGDEIYICDAGDLPIRGLHNLENTLAASLAGILAGVKGNQVGMAIKAFRGLSHRVELIDTIGGVAYIDDSKGTTVDSTLRALESSDDPVILIAGGRDKNSDYAKIRTIVSAKVKELILIGEAADRIESALGGVVRVHRASSMEEAVNLAYSHASPGWSVLLSPMCSSFDMFKDYKHRGDVFKESVKALKKCRAEGAISVP